MMCSSKSVIWSPFGQTQSLLQEGYILTCYSNNWNHNEKFADQEKKENTIE